VKMEAARFAETLIFYHNTTSITTQKASTWIFTTTSTSILHGVSEAGPTYVFRLLVVIILLKLGVGYYICTGLDGTFWCNFKLDSLARKILQKSCNCQLSRLNGLDLKHTKWHINNIYSFVLNIPTLISILKTLKMCVKPDMTFSTFSQPISIWIRDPKNLFLQYQYLFLLQQFLCSYAWTSKNWLQAVHQYLNIAVIRLEFIMDCY
jgi:hypothetical protein